MIYGFKTYQTKQDELVNKFLINSEQQYQWIEPQIKHSISPRDTHTWDRLKNVKKGDAVVYSGFLRDTKSIYEHAKKVGADFYYLDHPYYLHPNYFNKHYKTDTKNNLNHLLWGMRYFRATKNCFNCTSITDTSSKKYERMMKNEQEHLELQLKDWRKNGNHILVLPPSPTLYDTLGIDTDKVLNDTLKIVKENTDREIKIRYKKTGEMGRNPTDIREDLKDCWAVVSFGTAGAVKAIMSGIPVFCNEYSPTLPVSETDFSKIETPYYPDRKEWMYNLINNQFSFREVDYNEINIYRYLNEHYRN